MKYVKNGTVVCIQYSGIFLGKYLFEGDSFFLCLAASEVYKRNLMCAVAGPQILVFMYIMLYLMSCWKEMDMVHISLFSN